MSWIGQATRDLNDIQVRSKKYDFKKDARFMAQDGILFNQLQAGNIKLLVETKEEIKEAIVFETEATEKDFDALIDLKKNDLSKISNIYAENAKLKAENKSLKKELDELKAETESEQKQKKGK